MTWKIAGFDCDNFLRLNLLHERERFSKSLPGAWTTTDRMHVDPQKRLCMRGELFVFKLTWLVALGVQSRLREVNWSRVSPLPRPVLPCPALCACVVATAAQGKCRAKAPAPELLPFLPDRRPSPLRPPHAPARPPPSSPPDLETTETLASPVRG